MQLHMYNNIVATQRANQDSHENLTSFSALLFGFIIDVTVVMIKIMIKLNQINQELCEKTFNIDPLKENGICFALNVIFYAAARPIISFFSYTVFPLIRAPGAYLILEI